MKKKFLAILLGALMLVSMIPVSGMATSAAAENLIPNGDFESAFGSSADKPVPASTWKLVGHSIYNPGSLYRVESDTISVGEGEVTIMPASESSTAFIKVTRDLAQFESNNTAREVRATYAIPSGTLVAGQQYVFEYSINVPAPSGDGATGAVRVSTEDNSYDGPTVVGYGSGNATNGWVTRKDLFTCAEGTDYFVHVLIKSGTSADFVMYADDLKIYPIDSSNMIENGGFEYTFSTVSNVNAPSANWKVYTSDASTGSVTTVPASEFATPEGTNSAYSLKIEKTASSAYYNINFPISSSMLDKNDIYKLEFYYNIPAELTGTNGLNVGFTTDMQYNSNITGTAGLVKNQKTATDGWTKFTYTFKYTSFNSDPFYFRIGFRDCLAGSVAYVDEVSLTKIADNEENSLLSQDGTFEMDKTPNGTGDFITHSSAASGTNFEVVDDPTGVPNTVLKQLVSSNARGYITIPVQTTTYTTDDLFKVTFRFYVEADEAPTADYGLPVQYRENGQTKSTTMINPAVTITPAQFNTWVKYEAYVTPWNATGTTNRQFGIAVPSTYNTYFDDFEVVPVTSSVINLAAGAKAESKKIQNANAVADAYDSYGISFIPSDKASFAATETVKPLVIFAPQAAEGAEAASKSALAAVAVYSTENGVRTLKDIKLTTLTATEGNAAAVINSLNQDLTGIEGENLEVEAFLWNVTGLAPIAKAALGVAAQ